jgi:hypothetical protein
LATLVSTPTMEIVNVFHCTLTYENKNWGEGGMDEIKLDVYIALCQYMIFHVPIAIEWQAFKCYHVLN